MAAAKHHVKSSSAPATPQRPGSQPPVGELQLEKPVPSYLRQTISSCRNTSRRQSPPPPPRRTSTKSLVVVAAKKPAGKAPSSQLKERSVVPKPSNTTKAKTQKDNHCQKSQSFSRVTTTARRTKRTEAKQEEKGNDTDASAAAVAGGRVVAPTLLKSKSFSRVTMASKKKDANREERLPTSAAEEKMTGKDNASSTKPRGLPRAKDLSSSGGGSHEGGAGVVRLQAGNEGRRVVPKRPQESSQIEETASKLAERKNKVLALVGAFETVISLQEPEGQTSPFKVFSRENEEEEVEEVINKSDCGSDDRGGEETNMEVGEIVDQDRNRTDEKKEVQVEEPQKEKEISQHGQEKDEDEKNEMKSEKVKNETKSTTEVKERYRVGHESQQQQGEDNNNKEIESTESTEELTESTKEERKGSDLTVPRTEEEENAEESKLEV